MGSFWGRFGIVLGSFRDRFGIVLGSFWGRFGFVLGSFWDRFGIVLESFWGFLGPFFDMGFDWCVVSPAAVLHIGVLTAVVRRRRFLLGGVTGLLGNASPPFFACNGCKKEMRG